MFPSLLDMTNDESSKHLRELELVAYSSILAAVRAQGPLNSDKVKFLKDACDVLRITQDRHKAEMRRVILDERLNTIAYHAHGENSTLDDWVQEGRRQTSLLSRTTPQTAYSVIADEVADAASINNEQLPLPANTERKRTSSMAQMQSGMTECGKAVQFRIPESLKNDENKKRKFASFGVENSSLVQHLIGTPKISRIQQLYRQRTKAKVKEQQMHKKIRQQDLERDFKPIHQSRTLQHSIHSTHFSQQKYQQKLPLSPQSSASMSPKINILQNISLHAPVKEEESVEAIKTELNNFLGQKNSEQNRISPQPGCSNENLAPKQKQPITNIKTAQNVTYKHVASPGPSSETPKSIKICPTRKSITKGTTPGQKLVIVSSAQPITPSSILQRTLTIPFKNISVKNLDKFKIVSTSTNSSSLQISPLTNSESGTYTTNSAKHKVVTVRTNPSSKKLISLSHLQALNAKGSIKVVPLGGKILTKSSVISSSSQPLYIMNTAGNIQALTKSTSSTPVIMTTKPQESIVPSETKPVTKHQDSTPVIKIESPTADVSACVSTNSPVSAVLKGAVETGKSSVLADILKASGVISSDSETFSDDIESQITQLTAIPQTVPERIMADDLKFSVNSANESSEHVEFSENANEVMVTDEAANQQDDSIATYILLDKEQEADELVEQSQEEQPSSNNVGTLDPGTGHYSIDNVPIKCDGTESTTDSYLVELQQSNVQDVGASK